MSIRRVIVAKLTKLEIKLHEQALRLLEKDVLTFDDKHFVLDNWHEGATHMNSAAGAFFTPRSVAGGVAIEAAGRTFIDLCAGIGRLAFTVQNHLNPFQRENLNLEFVCCEINADYIEVGKKIMPEARWLQVDVMDLPSDIGHFDCAIGNPPFGNISTKQSSPRLKTGPFEYKVIDVASDLADYGVFIIPQGSAPFQFSGNRPFSYNETDSYKRFERETGIVLNPNCGIDTSVGDEDEPTWRGVKIVTEIVVADFNEARERRNPVADLDVEEEDNLILPLTGELEQLELFPVAV